MTDKKYQEAISILPDELQIPLNSIPNELKKEINEIRIRADRPIVLHTDSSIYYPNNFGVLKSKPESGFKASVKSIEEIMYNACNHSVYAHTEDIKKGFLTIKGGHRVGFCGTYAYAEDKILNQSDISSVNIRIAREVYKCSSALEKIFFDGLHNLLICGPPLSGKTTILRDLARYLSDGADGEKRACKTVIIDERGEFASVFDGVPQNDVGNNTDVISYCRKSDGIVNAIRSLSPDLIVCDEIGSREDINALALCATCGVKVISSVHCGNSNELKYKPFYNKLLYSFEYFAFTSGIGKASRIQKIIDRNGMMV
ncbi:MAG: stage III sporulation protein AA [Acutalibacteraceae bacterium]